jgi:RimJ/RimL family protein N-acetyltransferase
VQPLEIPRVEIDRLVLRAWSAADVDPFAEMSADPEVMRFLGGVADRAASWRGIALHAGHWTLRGYGNWAVDRRADGRLLGRVGLWYPEGWPGVEVGWTLARHAWGAGYATEAARASVAWAWANLDIERLISLIDPDNAASVRVAERLGMRPVGEHVLGGTPVVIWGLDRPG